MTIYVWIVDLFVFDVRIDICIGFYIKIFHLYMVFYIKIFHLYMVFYIKLFNVSNEAKIFPSLGQRS